MREKESPWENERGCLQYLKKVMQTWRGLEGVGFMKKRVGMEQRERWLRKQSKGKDVSHTE